MQGSRLKEVRLTFGLKQKEFGEKIGLTHPQIKNIETGLQKLTIDVADIIATKLAINGWWLLTGKGSMYLEEKKSNGNVDTGFQDCEINNNKGSIAINISRSDFKDDSAEVEELISLLKFAPKSFIIRIIEKLRAFKELSQI